jgi:cell division protein FtsB
MSFVGWAKRAALAALPPVLFLSLTGYFCWNATRGEHGLTTYGLREKQLVAAQAEFKAADSERDAWENRVAGLRANHIDPDTLDERSRAMLNLADPADIVVPYGQKNKLF